MRLPYLDQLVSLERGEAALLARALAVLVAVLVEDATRQPMPVIDALQLTPLASLGRRLVQRHKLEQHRPPGARGRPARAWLLRVRYDELAAVHLNRGALLYTGLQQAEQLQLQVVLGRFHQKSLNLDRYIKFSS